MSNLDLSRDALLANKKPDVVLVNLPDGVVYVRVMTARQKEQYERAVTGNDGIKKTDCIRASLVISTACDASGALLFSAADFDAVGDLPMTVIGPIFDAAVKANGMAADAVDDAQKN
jgi:hypothetical protein